MTSPKEKLLEIEGEMRRPARWFGLHVSLNARDMSERAILGFALRATTPVSLLLRACLRSRRTGGYFTDCFFDKPVTVVSSPSLHLDVIETASKGLSDKSLWRDLVLFLPIRSFGVTLHNLRDFVV